MTMLAENHQIMMVSTMLMGLSIPILFFCNTEMGVSEGLVEMVR